MCDLCCRMSGSKNEHQLEYTTDNFNEGWSIFCFVFQGRICLCSPSCPRTKSVDQAVAKDHVNRVLLGYSPIVHS